MICTDDVDTRLSPASSTLTDGTVANTAPAPAPTGCVLTDSFVAAPTVGTTDCVATVRSSSSTVAEYVMVYVVPATPIMPRSTNVATPLTAVAVVVPTNVAPLPTEAVTTVVLSLVTTLPLPSCSATCGCVENAAPTAAPSGSRTETTWVGNVAMTIALLAPNDPTAPGDGSVSVAALPTPSRMVPPFNASAVVDT